MSSIGFKDMKVLGNMFKVTWHEILISLVKWLFVRYSKDTIIVTCAYEKRDYGSVHSMNPLRGLDLRSRVFEDPFQIESDINKHWQYDPQRTDMKVCLYHDTGRGKHFHLQVHPRTIHLGG